MPAAIDAASFFSVEDPGFSRRYEPSEALVMYHYVSLRNITLYHLSTLPDEFSYAHRRKNLETRHGRRKRMMVAAKLNAEGEEEKGRRGGMQTAEEKPR